jgi:sialate O-acetylesterase
MGNSETRTGYGCELPAMVDLWRSVWHVQEGGGDPPIFGVATLAAGGSEGNGQHMGGMRWSQTANYGTLPNTAMRDSFLAQVYDLGDPWAAMGDGNSNMDANHCALPDPATGKYGTSQSFF